MSAEPDKIVEFESVTGRTEEQATFNDPIIINIGGISYSVKKPVIRKAREWRSKLIKMQGTLQAQTGNGAGEWEIAGYVNESHMPAIAELVAAYCEPAGLTVDKIETEGTDEELVDAFMAIMKHCRIPLDRMRV